VDLFSIFRALPNNAKGAHLIYLGQHLSTCYRTAVHAFAEIMQGY